MSDNPQVLDQAYALIEAQKLGEARALLDKYLATDKNSVDAWWLYAHAVEDPKQAVTALENVTRIDPNHAEAKSLLESARQQAGVSAPSDDDFDIDFDDESLAPKEDAEPADTRRRSFIIFGVIVALVALGIIILAFAPRPQTPATDVTPTFVSQNVDIQTSQVQIIIPLETDANATIQTDDISLTLTAEFQVVIQPTTEVLNTNTPTDATPVVDFATATPFAQTVVTPEVVQPSVDAFLASLATNYPTSGTTETVNTVMGATLLVQMCTTRGEAHNSLIPNAMAGLSQAIELLPADYVGVGVRFSDCSANETINVMIMPSQSALEYKNADLSEQDFRRSWRVVDA
ncbi:MAG: hypothetical protein MUE54_03410 [Anaerolineae bacterium]|nr:hypothetical protein [Anaerolineae bacterium]